MSLAANKKIVQRLTDEVWNKGNIELVPELFDSGFVFHSATDNFGLEAYRNYVVMMRSALPGHDNIEHLFAGGDMVAAFYRAAGIFSHELMGIPPTGKMFTITVATLYRFKNGKIAEAWEYTDTQNLQKQIGFRLNT